MPLGWSPKHPICVFSQFSPKTKFLKSSNFSSAPKFPASQSSATWPASSRFFQCTIADVSVREKSRSASGDGPEEIPKALQGFLAVKISMLADLLDLR